jgi:hypothetical protein
VSVTTNRLAAEERFARFLEHTNPGYRVCKVAMSDILPRPLLMAVGGYQYRMYSVFTTDANGKVELTLETMQALESDVGMNIVVVLFDLQNLRVLTVKSADLVKFMKGRKRNVVSVGAW